ncbi:MAG: DUF21 domain-containing protein [Sphingobacteriales bacterium]|nr:DUF21 domain-containing protein [Sphingobacteriales bacterium]MBP9141604.1 DUF21 domain-containing protein [Chitinophagales bacterium]MDA0198468.1 CNNM domain-containing protein [Bacteroidota bacterium]MBK6890797.1 DUF21 domain-containing protein [Sphingobacteriales bacterium]MBK7526149.1 DUF21 domain-containing protein [Sphingobacteriales bacterium]
MEALSDVPLGWAFSPNLSYHLPINLAWFYYYIWPGWWIAALVLLLFSTALAFAEIAFFGLSPYVLRQLRKEPTAENETLRLLLEKPYRLLANLLLAQYLCNAAFAVLLFEALALSNPLPLNWYNWVLYGLIVAALLALFTKLLPRLLAANQSVHLRLAQAAANPVLVVSKILLPFAALLEKAMQWAELRINNAMANEPLDIDSTLDRVAGSENVNPQNINLLKGLVTFNDIYVAQIMRTRTEMFALDTNLNFEALLAEVVDNSYSRIPVYTQSLDHVTGILYAKALLDHLSEPPDFNWHVLLRPPFFVPETQKIADLLRQMQRNHIHIAIVINEYGITSGLLTLEDILEEIVGDINDEFDVAEIKHKQIDSNTFVFEAKTSLQDAARIMNIDRAEFDDLGGDYESVAGLVLQLAGYLPEPNETFTYKQFKFTVLEKSETRILRLKIKIKTAK